MADDNAPHRVDWNVVGPRVGLFGGSFDPVTRAHIAVAQSALSYGKLDDIVFVPTKKNPLKPHGPVASDDDRVRMLELALSEAYAKHLWISDIELQRPPPSFSCTTVQEVKGLLPESEISFVFGSDILPALSRWHKVDELFRLLDGVVCVERVGFPRDLINGLAIPAETKEMLLAGFLEASIPSSSTEVREILRTEPDTARALLHDQVFRFLTDNKSYSQKTI